MAKQTIEQQIHNKLGKLVDLVDKESGNTINGDMWRLAAVLEKQMASRIQTTRDQLRRLEIDHERIEKIIRRIEKRWEDPML